jgi:membrane protease YdiL (CAAX protease family)
MQQKIPVIITAIFGGLIVAEIGIIAWTADFTLLPWTLSPILMIGLLWLYCRYFSGYGWPNSSSAARKERFRALRLSSRNWKWALAGAILFVVILESALMVTFRLVSFPTQLFKSQYAVLNTLPSGLGWCVVIVSAMAAGICEETGFRGYMQVPLEKRYGAVRAILVTSIVFTLLHLNKAWAPAILPQIFLAGMLWGILAYRSGSLIPGIIAHVLADVINFAYWWSDVGGDFKRETIFRSGLDGHFIGCSVLLVAAGIAFFWTMGKLRRGGSGTENKTMGRVPADPI